MADNSSDFGFDGNGESDFEGDDTAGAMALVLTETVAAITADTLQRSWQLAWPGRPTPASFTSEPDDDGTLAFDLEGSMCAVSVMPSRVPGDAVDPETTQSWLWPTAASEVARYGAFIVVWVSGPGSPADTYWHLTRVVSSVIRATDTLGVYMMTSDIPHLVQSEVFDEIAHEYDDESLPVMLWIDLPAFVEEGLASVFTIGLSRFGVPEVEIADSVRPVGELREFAMDLATYLIDAGPVLADGHTVGSSETDQTVVRVTDSIVDRPDPVYRIEGY